MSTRIGCNGAGDGNRTHVTSLEGWNSTIELHPQTLTTDDILSNYGLFVNAFRHILVSIPFYFRHHHPLIRKKRRGTRLFASLFTLIRSQSFHPYRSLLSKPPARQSAPQAAYKSDLPPDGESPASGLWRRSYCRRPLLQSKAEKRTPPL